VVVIAGTRRSPTQPQRSAAVIAARAVTRMRNGGNGRVGGRTAGVVAFPPAPAGPGAAAATGTGPLARAPARRSAASAPFARRRSSTRLSCSIHVGLEAATKRATLRTDSRASTLVAATSTASRARILRLTIRKPSRPVSYTHLLSGGSPPEVLGAVLLELGSAAAENGEAKTAAARWQEAFERGDPRTQAAAAANLGRLAAARGDATGAERMFQRAMEPPEGPHVQVVADGLVTLASQAAAEERWDDVCLLYTSRCV